MPSQSQRLSNLPPYVFAVISERIRQLEKSGTDIVRLDIGNPDMPPPDHVIEALAKSAQQPGNHGYGGYRGTPGFRQAVADYYQQRFGVSLDPETEVLPLIGSKEGIVNLALAFLDKGDVALVPDVGYPSYDMGTRMAEAEVYWLPVNEQNRYIPDLDAIPADVAKRAKILWVNYPNNPTGATADLDFYRKAVTFCLDHDVLLASDNPYADITFDGYSAPSALAVPDARRCTLEFFSLSKSHNMAGWRIGAAVGSASALKSLLQVKSNVDSGHFRPIYDAAAEALNNTPRDWINQRNLIYQARRDRVLAALPQIGLEARKQAGSLYVWAKVLDGNVTAYVEQALVSAHVSIAPGGAYGPGGNDYVRISLGTPDDRLDTALERLKKWYANK